MLLLPACSNQAEGERCDLDNANLDCESGLICKSVQSLGGTGEGAICCPEGSPGVAACRPGSLQLDDDGDDTSSDAPSEEDDAEPDDAEDADDADDSADDPDSAGDDTGEADEDAIDDSAGEESSNPSTLDAGSSTDAGASDAG